jgi:hypothetical protein
MRRILLIGILCFTVQSYGQKILAWQVLTLTQYSIISEGSDEGLYKPKFPDILLKYETPEVSISGYIIPMDIDNNTYALSMTPFSSCFFCGNAGPNTALELSFKEKQNKFLVDQFVIIKGKLILNRYNPHQLFFKITNAEIEG